jgi:hypothetical protein
MSDVERSIAAMEDLTVSDTRTHEVLVAVTRLYEDARARTDVIRGIALAAMGVLSVLAALTDLGSIAALGGWAIPALVLIGIGLVASLAVLFKTPVMVPYDSRRMAEVAHSLECDIASEMLRCATEAEAYTRTHNNHAARLVNVTLASFVAGVLVLIFQLAIGPRIGIAVGGATAIGVVGAALVVRKYAFVDPAMEVTRNE